MNPAHRSPFKRALLLGGLVVVTPALAQFAGTREFPPATLQSVGELPASRFRRDLENLPGAAQARAMEWLRNVHFTELDLADLHVDQAGGVLYACAIDPLADVATGIDESPQIGMAAVPVSPFPASLKFHSRPGSANILYLNFEGENVTGTEWNDELGRAEIPAMPFSSDSDYTTYSDSEQLFIQRVWQRMAEDFAPFNIDVTTERPATLGTRTAMALITRTTDANGDPNPFENAGGVAYLNVFGTSSYADYRPAWIYHDNFGHSESFTAEAASHEIGHNLGLSHDGRTDGSDYYGGHGSGDISWGPLMGTGYNRNVTQWSKGEYYRANNTQDDLATIAGKITYRSDDHGNTSGTATPVLLSNGTNIVSTSPENDPANANPANKGILERNTDVDVFSFVTGHGAVRLAVAPWVMPASYRGGNVDLRIELFDESGALVQSNNPPTQTTALVQTTLSAGRYYLHIRNSGAGDPFISTPTGYTSYGSIGQYFISGYVTEAADIIVPPTAELQITDLTESGQPAKEFTVNYSDDMAVDASTIDDNDLRVTGPNGYDQLARLVSVNLTTDGTPRIATYAVDPPGGGTWLPAHNGTYTVSILAEQVADHQGAWVAAGQLGQFNVGVVSAIYFASMDVDPGWTLDPQWQYGTPAYSGGGPTSGYTGTQIIGYNLSGNYANNLPARYATTPPINASGTTSLTLRFRRWLGVRSNDSARIQASADGTTWQDVWVSSGNIADSAWQQVQYSLPTQVAGSSSLRLRWVISSNPALNEIGWNIDDVELLGDATLDTMPPSPGLSVADLTLSGSPSHSCSVTYTDDTAVRLSTLDSTDLLVTGPGGYTNYAEFVGADLPIDGSPLTGTYSISAPGGTWDAADNGTYTVTLLEGSVADTLNNSIVQTVLGTFTVALAEPEPGILEVTPAEGLTSTGYRGDSFQPSAMVYTLANTGGTQLDWTAGKTAGWLDLSATGGTLDPGTSTNLTVTLNTNAHTLGVGVYGDTLTVATAAAGGAVYLLPMTLEVAGPPEFVAHSLDESGSLQMVIKALAETEVVIEASPDFQQWTAISTNVVAADGTMSFTDPSSGEPKTRWYRARATR